MKRVHWKDKSTEENNLSPVDGNSNHSFNIREKVCINLRENVDNTFSESASNFNIGSISEKSSNDRTDFCTRCQETIELLQREKRELGAKLIEHAYHAKYNIKCRCRLKDDLEVIQREERCIIETIELKKERIANLKESDTKLTNDIKIAKDNVSDKIATYNGIVECLESTEQTYYNNCQDIKNKQNINIEMEKSIVKLQSDTKEIAKEIKIHQKEFENKKKALDELLQICKKNQEKIDEQKKILMNYDEIATQIQARIKHLKSELKMMAESQQFHQQEIAARTEQLAKIKHEKHNYDNLLAKAQADLHTIQQTINTHKELKQANEKMYTDLKGETQELGELLEKEKKEKILLAHKLKTTQEINENVEFEMKTDEENYSRILLIIKDIKGKRCNAEDELIKLANEGKQKIQTLLDECSQYELMFKDCVLIKKILERDNEVVEKTLVDRKTDVYEIHNLKVLLHEDVTADELEARLARHHEVIQAMKGRFADTEDMFNNRKQDQEQYEWCSPIRKYELNQKKLNVAENKLQPKFKEVACIDIKYKCSAECNNDGVCCADSHKVTNK